MLSIICGAALIAISSASFWRLLPCDGRLHPLVNRFDGGSTIMIVIMFLAICGTAVVIRRGLHKQPLGPLAWAVGIFWLLIVAWAEHLFG
jgi:hypothetical protein